MHWRHTCRNLCLLFFQLSDGQLDLSYLCIFRRLSGLVRSQQSLWALTPWRVLPRADHHFLCKATRLSLLLVTVWRYSPSSAQSRFCRANQRRSSDILHHCFQVEITRSTIRSLSCNSSLESQTLHVMTLHCCSPSKDLKTAPASLVLSQMALAICMPLHNINSRHTLPP